MNKKQRKHHLGMPAAEWEHLFRQAAVQVEALDGAKSHQAKATVVGKYLSRYVGRPVPVEIKGRTGTATLRSCPAGKNKTHYYFSIEFGDDPGSRSSSGGPMRPGGGSSLRRNDDSDADEHGRTKPRRKNRKRAKHRKGSASTAR